MEINEQQKGGLPSACRMFYTLEGSYLNLPSLATRRTTMAVVFINHLKIDLLSQLHFSAPNKITRNYLPLILINCTPNYALLEPCSVLWYSKLYSTVANNNNNSIPSYISSSFPILLTILICFLLKTLTLLIWLRFSGVSPIFCNKCWIGSFFPIWMKSILI